MIKYLSLQQHILEMHWETRKNKNSIEEFDNKRGNVDSTYLFWPVNSLHKGPVTRKMFPFDDVIMTLI